MFTSLSPSQNRHCMRVSCFLLVSRLAAIFKKYVAANLIKIITEKNTYKETENLLFYSDTANRLLVENRIVCNSTDRYRSFRGTRSTQDCKIKRDFIFLSHTPIIFLKSNTECRSVKVLKYNLFFSFELSSKIYLK